MAQRAAAAIVMAGLLGVQLHAGGLNARELGSAAHAGTTFSVKSGPYVVAFKASGGTITVTPKGKKAHLAIRELGTDKKSDLLYSVHTVRHSGSTYTMSGNAGWATFSLALTLPPGQPGLLHFVLSLVPQKSAPVARRSVPDVQVVGAPASTITLYDPAPPIAGSSLFVSDKQLGSSVLYLANLTTLGTFFDRSQTGASQPNFDYPRAGGKGGLVGLNGSYFGYPPPVNSLDNLPRGKSTRVIDSYLYLAPGVPSNEASVDDSYLKALGTVYGALAKPVIPSADWHALAAKGAGDLVDPSNLVSLNGQRYLVSYVSDNRKSPELITQASVLAGVKAYEAKFHETLPLDAILEQNLSTFYDSTFHTVKNGLGHDPAATEESWYYITNLISLLQAAQQGSTISRQLLLDSIQGAISLAHANQYEFPQNFQFSNWNGQNTGLQPDVAGGYAWLMLGVYDLTKDSQYLDEAKASIAHVAGKGFGLAYETHMLGYTAAAAQRLYTMTNDPAYHADALLALANLFHVTRLWDCTYGNCRKGAGYHTYFGLNPLPWSDYIAPLEQYEAWLGLRDYLAYAANEPAYIKALVQGFITETPLTMQYTLPTRLPAGVATASPGEYSFVTKNVLTWNIPLEDLRVGEQNSGIIGQEVYGAGGMFMLAAYAP
jgi:hypothetical protein